MITYRNEDNNADTLRRIESCAWRTVAKGRRREKRSLGDSRRDATVRNKSDIFISTGVSSVARVRHRASASINIHGPGFLSGVRSELSLHEQQRRDVRLAAGETRLLRKNSSVGHNLRKRSLSMDIHDIITIATMHLGKKIKQLYVCQ